MYHMNICNVSRMNIIVKYKLNNWGFEGLKKKKHLEYSYEKNGKIKQIIYILFLILSTYFTED